MEISDIFGKTTNGTLDAVICRNFGEYGVDNWDESKGDKHLNVSIDYIDFMNLHSETYRITFGAKPETELFYSTNLGNILKEISNKFPMLCRIKDMYEDALFEVVEVKMLRDECVKLKSESQDDSTDLALRKLFYCCDAAIKTKLNLGFYCD